MSKIRQFIVFILFSCVLVIVVTIALGRTLQTRTRDRLAQELMKQQMALTAQFITSLETGIESAHEALLLMSYADGIQSQDAAVCSASLAKAAGGGALRAFSFVGRVNREVLVDCSTKDPVEYEIEKITVNIHRELQRRIGEGAGEAYLPKTGTVGQDITPDGSGRVQSVVGDVFFWKGTPFLPMGVFLPKENEEKERFLVGVLSLSEIEKRYLAYLGRVAQGNMLLVDERGILLSATHPSYKSLIGEDIGFSLAQGDLLKNPRLQYTSSLALNGYSGTDRYSVHGKDSSITYQGTEILKSKKWAAIMHVATDDVDALIASLLTSQQRIFIVLFIITVLLLSSIILIVFIVDIVKPVEGLRKAAYKISQGELDTEIPFRPEDEIGQLGMALVQMEKKLKDLYGGLEERVRQRGDQLAERMQQLKREKAKDVAILESIGEGLVVTGHDGNVIILNEEAERLLVVKAHQVIGRMFARVVRAEDERDSEIPLMSNPIFMVLSTGRRMSTTLQYVRGDTTKFLASVNVSPIIIEGKIIGTVQIFRDITHEKEVDRMKTEFISLASHQLRTPLSAMKWFLEMLLAGDAGELTKEQRYFLENVNKSNERMIQLVNALLNVSRIESGRIIIDPKPTDLGKLFSEVLSEYISKIEVKKLHLSVSVHPQLPIINVDPKLIREVYVNLLSNAIKYTPSDGEIAVFISKKENAVISQISDTGYGIPKEQQARVFQKFYRGENIIPIEAEGSGLGLYLAKAVIESSGGQIWFESEAGKGTTIWFSLPLSGSPARVGEVSLNT